MTYDTYIHSVPALQDDAAERAAQLLDRGKASEEEHDTQEEERQEQEGEDR